MKTFQEIDDALYEHERAYYHWCATGAGSNPMGDPEWVLRREYLTGLYNLYCPKYPPAPKKRGWYARALERLNIVIS